MHVKYYVYIVPIAGVLFVSIAIYENQDLNKTECLSMLVCHQVSYLARSEVHGYSMVFHSQERHLP